MSKFAQLTFLHGPRGCPGRNMAMAEIRRIVAALVDAFELTVDQNCEQQSEGFMASWPRAGLRIGLTQCGRNRWMHRV
jgi:cytochrome P450